MHDYSYIKRRVYQQSHKDHLIVENIPATAEAYKQLLESAEKVKQSFRKAFFKTFLNNTPLLLFLGVLWLTVPWFFFFCFYMSMKRDYPQEVETEIVQEKEKTD